MRPWGVALGAAALLAWMVAPAAAQVPQPVAVPTETPEPAKADLLRRRSSLLEERQALRGRVEAHNSRCRGVPEKSAAAAECAAAQARLNEAVAAYAAAVRDFNAAVAAAPSSPAKAVGEPPKDYAECTKWCRDQFLPDVDKVRSCIAANCRASSEGLLPRPEPRPPRVPLPRPVLPR